MSNIPKRNLASGCHLLKKIDQPSWRTTRRNYKHIPQIVCISSRFRVLHLLSWEFEQSEILWRYTVTLVCHLKHVEVGWSTRNYPHTGCNEPRHYKYQDTRSFTQNSMHMYWKLVFLYPRSVVAHTWPSCKVTWRKTFPTLILLLHRSFVINKKEENFNWTLVNTENLRV